MEILRHIGKMASTDRRLVVVYMQIPGREDHALVVDSDALHPKYHDELMQLVKGEGQKFPVLADLLGRRILSYTNQDMLTSLHQAGKLDAVPVKNVIMLPQPNQAIPLVKLIELMNAANGKAPVAPVAEENLENRVIENQNIDRNNAQYQIAANILEEAKMLEAEAKRKRETAYNTYPPLRGAVQGGPSIVPNAVAEALPPGILEKGVAPEAPVEAEDRRSFTVDVPGVNDLTVETALQYLTEQGFQLSTKAAAKANPDAAIIMKPQRKSPEKKAS